MKNLFNQSIKMFSSIKYNDKYSIKNPFRTVSTNSNASNLGSVPIIINRKIKHVNSIDFDLKEKNKNIDLYKISSKKIIINRKCKKIATQKSKTKESPLRNIKKSIEDFNLNIDKNSSNSYSGNTINKIPIIQNLSNGFYRIKKYDDYKIMLQNNIVRSFITALEFHDDYTKGHSELVAIFSVRIGESLGLNKKQLENLYWAAVMHDIGKTLIPVEILNKVEKLTNSEFDLLKKHPQIGYEMTSKSKILKNISKYILFHHERWDGKGYPNGLIGDEIPLLSQIISVADCWHAMTSKRSYKKNLSKEDAIKDLIKNRGTQFSPEIIDIFIEKKLYLIDEYLKGNKIEFKYA